MSWHLGTIMAGLLVVGGVAAWGQEVAAEFALGELHGVEVATKVPGYSGAGYVTGFDAEGTTCRCMWRWLRRGSMTCTCGTTRHGAARGTTCRWMGRRSGDLRRDGGDTVGGDGGRAALLAAGGHDIKLGKGWGWFNVDRVRLTPVTVAPPAKVAGELSDPQATAEARALYAWLQSIYGRKTIAGNRWAGRRSWRGLRRRRASSRRCGV